MVFLVLALIIGRPERPMIVSHAANTTLWIIDQLRRK